MSVIGAEDDAFVICEDTPRSIMDYLENTQVLLSGIINQEDGNYNDNNNSEINIRMVSCDQVQEFIFINNNNIYGTYLNRWRLH